MRQFFAVFYAIYAVSAGAVTAAAQTTTTVFPPSGNYDEACGVSTPSSNDPQGLLVFGSVQYQNLHQNLTQSISGPIERLLPPNESVKYWGLCQFGNASQDNVVVPGSNNSFFGSDLLGGTPLGGDPEFFVFPGSIFTVSPTPSGSDTTTAIHTFSFTPPPGKNTTPDGDGPTSLVRAASGALFGATFEGGPSGGGTVFRLTAPAGQGFAWTETVLHAFGGSQGSVPLVSLIGPDGAVYGTTDPSSNDTVAASVWRLAPSGAGWTLSVLHRFTDFPRGSSLSTLVRGSDGSIYGTVGASHGGPTVFRLTPPESSGSWTYGVIYHLPIPSTAFANLSYVASDDTIYGFSAYYSSPCASGSCGRVWQLQPPRNVAGWTAAVLHDFADDPALAPYPTPVRVVRLAFRRDPSGFVGLYGLKLGGLNPPFELIRISEVGWK